MKTPEQYYKEVIDRAISLWEKNKKEDRFQDMENDPVVNLLLKALAHQSYLIQNDMEHYEENMLHNLRDRIVPHHLTQPVPAFSIVQAKLKKEVEPIIVDENYKFEFKNNKEEYHFTPLLTTKIINAEVRNVKYDGEANTLFCTLKSDKEIRDMSGVSFYFDTDEPVESVKIVERNSEVEMPIIKPNQYNELPFTAWFNNNHWFLNENFHLFGNYDYWQKIFLEKNANIYYIDNYDTNKIYFNNSPEVNLAIVFKRSMNGEDLQPKINCIPIVQVSKNDIKLDKNNPIRKLVGKNKEDVFLNLLCDSGEKDIEEYTNKFIIRQFGVERYNPQMLLEQLREIERRYISDYYAFQDIGRYDFSIDKKDNAVKTLQDVLREVIAKMTDKLEENEQSIKGNHHYAVLQNEIHESVFINYLTTSGDKANEIKKDVKVKTSPLFDAELLMDTQGGRNAITDESQKEDIAKYYFQTKDKLVTIADVRAFCYKELESKNIEKINIEKQCNTLIIKAILKENHNIEDKQIEILKRKLSLHTNNYNVQLYTEPQI